MKVLMFGWEFPPHITGGLGTACYGLTKALLKQGAEVIFVAPKLYGDEDRMTMELVNASEVTVNLKDVLLRKYWEHFTYLEISSNLVPYTSPEEFSSLVEHTDEFSEKSENTIFSTHYQFSGKYGANLMEEVSRYALVATQIALNKDFDVIHAHDWLTYSAGIAAKKISGKPLVVHMHATEFDRSGENINELVFNIEKNGMLEADYVITVSNLTRNIVINKYGIPEEKVITVHNGVEPNENANLSKYTKNVIEKIVTFLGRITYQKGPDYFIEAARKVLKKDKNVRFVMAGSGDLLNKSIRRVAQLNMAHKFHFTGFLKGEDVDHMFAISDVYVMPSVSEPFGIAPLEAMRSNVPVIISKQSGVSEVLKHAIKVDFWDIDATADAIYGILNYKALSEMFLKHAKVEVDNIKWDKAAYNVLQVYQKSIEQ